MSINLKVKRALTSYKRKYKNFLHWYGIAIVDGGCMYEFEYLKAKNEFKKSYEKYFELCNKYNKEIKFNTTLL